MAFCLTPCKAFLVQKPSGSLWSSTRLWWYPKFSLCVLHTVPSHYPQSSKKAKAIVCWFHPRSNKKRNFILIKSGRTLYMKEGFHFIWHHPFDTKLSKSLLSFPVESSIKIIGTVCFRILHEQWVNNIREEKELWDNVSLNWGSTIWARRF